MPLNHSICLLKLLSPVARNYLRFFWSAKLFDSKLLSFLFLLAQFLSQNSTENFIILQATSYEIDIPSDFTYKGILRLTREAAEWKDYYFYSCADVEIVNPSVSCI